MNPQEPQIMTLINNAFTKCPNYDKNLSYVLEIKKLNLFNTEFKRQIDEVKEEILQLQKTLSTPIKKQRRKAHEIIKRFGCTSCQKFYGSEASLNLHFKIKHSTSEQESKTHPELIVQN